jgi:hypothetical protein
MTPSAWRQANIDFGMNWKTNRFSSEVPGIQRLDNYAKSRAIHRTLSSAGQAGKAQDVPIV